MVQISRITELYMNEYIQTSVPERIVFQTLKKNVGKHFLMVHISQQVFYLCPFSSFFSFLWTPLLVWRFHDHHLDIGSFWLISLLWTKTSQQLETIFCQTLTAKEKKIIIITVLKNVKLPQICWEQLKKAFVSDTDICI